MPKLMTVEQQESMKANHMHSKMSKKDRLVLTGQILKDEVKENLATMPDDLKKLVKSAKTAINKHTDSKSKHLFALYWVWLAVIVAIIAAPFTRLIYSCSWVSVLALYVLTDKDKNPITMKHFQYKEYLITQIKWNAEQKE